MNEEVEFQREIAQLALAGIASSGFALAGSGAIREHGVTERPTEDVDLFTSRRDRQLFDNAVERVTADLRSAGCSVELTRRSEEFARLLVLAEDGRQSVEVDFGVDWRDQEPVTLAVGPVLSLTDAVGSKVSALYSRGEPRDYLDVDAIRASGRFTDAELIAGAIARDPGFEIAVFARQLTNARHINLLDVLRYGLDATTLAALQKRCAEWAAQLRDSAASEDHRSG